MNLGFNFQAFLLEIPWLAYPAVITKMNGIKHAFIISSEVITFMILSPESTVIHIFYRP